MKRFEIIHEDDAIIVVDKPSGMLVIPSPRNEAHTLTALVNQYLDGRGVEVNAYPCHRIDRETSGIMVFAKGKRFQRDMMEEFKKRKVVKRYIAFIQGRLERPSGTLKGALYSRNKRRYQWAVTHYKLIKALRGFSVLEVQPITGRTNQIRAQFAEIGHPLLGERIFAFGRDFAIRFKRVALHARALEFRHPVTKKRVAFSSDLPEDMRQLIG